MGFSLNGCTKAKVIYSRNFQGVPIYPGTELLSSNDLGQNMLHELYANMYFKGKFEDVKKYYETNIDKTVWEVNLAKEPNISHGIDEICAYTLKNKDREVRVTITYSKKSKGLDNQITVSITGDK